MRLACDNVYRMSSMVQIRNVPDELHRELKVRAARAGMTLSDYLLDELRNLAVRPTMREWVREARRLEPVGVSMSPAEVLREERDR
jgi:antitoxin FitA